MKNIPIGVENFEKLITEDYYYIDKTMFIKELLDKKSDVNLFTRPRRFGKTLLLSMLRYFFEDSRDRRGNKKEYRHLFEGLAIMEEGEKYTRHMGQYPVVSLTLKSGKQRTLESSFSCLVYAIADEFQRHSYILKEKDLFGEEDIEQYKRYQNKKADINEYKQSLKFLCCCLENYYDNKVILLLDEYDVPLEGAYVNHFYPEMIDFIRELLGAALKTNDSLYFAVLTGCLRISRESIFTGLNNLDINTILSGGYSEYFGFTEPEVENMCREYGMEDLYPTVKEWYNGYIFGECNIYNPWSTLKFVKDRLVTRNVLPLPYWVNTSSNDIIRKMIQISDDDARDDIERFIRGEAVWKYLHEDVTYDEIESSPENLWNFMFFTGYFKKLECRYDVEEKKYYAKLAIPNEEIRYIFSNKIEEWFREKTRETNRSLMFNAIVSGDAKTFEAELAKLLQQTISFHDYQENYYHGFLAGVLTGMTGYVVKSNRESGSGRTDLFVKPLSRRNCAFILEFKVAGSIAQLEPKAWEAIRQIEKKNYRQELLDDGYVEVKNYGAAFFKKDCAVVLEE